MEIIKSTLTNSDCYRASRKITVKGLMIHSIGTPQPDPMVFVRNWNRPGVNACVHAFIGADGKVYQTLPWTHRAWHGASGPKGSVNNTHIGVEMTEPNTIVYLSGSNYRNLDAVRTRVHVMATYLTAVELFAYLAKKFNLDPLKNIISHAEGYRLGIASNHGDPEHLWRAHGLTMSGFRAAVKAKMDNMSGPIVIPTIEYPVAYKNEKGSHVEALQKNLVKLGFLTNADVDGSYGPITIKAVESFQRANGLTVDGQAGRNTQAKLKEEILALEKKEKVKEEPISGTVKVIYKGSDGLFVRSEPSFDNSSIKQVVRYGEVFTVAAKTDNFYKLKSGLYITSGDTYVEYKAAPAIKKKYKTTTANLNMRTGPGANHSKILIIPAQTKVEVLKSMNGWDQIIYNAKTGWSSAEYLTAEEAPKVEPKTIKVKVDVSALNIRKEPTTASSIVGKVSEGEVFTITEVQGKWGKLKSGLGWIYLDYTTKL